MAKKKELVKAPPLSMTARLMSQLQESGMAIETAASAMAKWRYIDFVNPHAMLPCFTLEWLLGARGFLAGRILQLRAKYSKGKSSFMYLQYAISQIMSKAFCYHQETEGAHAPADYIAGFGADPEGLLVTETQSLEDCLESIDKMICTIRGGFDGMANQEGRMLKTKFTDPIDPQCLYPIVMGVDSLSSLGKKSSVGVDVVDAEATAQLSYHTRKLREFFRDRVGRFRDSQTLLMLTSHETAKIEMGKKSFGAPPGGDKSSLAGEAIGIHATYGMDVNASPYKDKATGNQLGEVVRMKTFKNKLSPKNREVELFLVWNKGFDLTHTDFNFLCSHGSSPLAPADKEKPLLYRHSAGITCKLVSNKSFASEGDFLHAFYSNADLVASLREKMRIRGCGFKFETDFLNRNPAGELPDAPAAAVDGSPLAADEAAELGLEPTPPEE